MATRTGVRPVVGDEHRMQARRENVKFLLDHGASLSEVARRLGLSMSVVEKVAEGMERG